MHIPHSLCLLARKLAENSLSSLPYTTNPLNVLVKKILAMKDFIFFKLTFFAASF